MNVREAQQLEAAIDQALDREDVVEAERLVQHYVATAGAVNPTAPATSFWFRAHYLSGQVALAAGQLQRALGEFSSLLAAGTDLPPQLGVRLRLLQGEALARLGQHPSALTVLAHISETLLDSDPRLRLRALRIRLGCGQVADLGPALQDCTRKLEAAEDWANLALLHIEEGRAWDAAGELERAELCWHMAEQLSEQHSGQAIRADVQLQLGRLDHLRGRLPAALARYDAALAGSPHHVQRQELQLRAALVRLELGQVEPVRRLVLQVLPSGDPSDLPEDLRPLATMFLFLFGIPGNSPVNTEERAFALLQARDMTGSRELYQQALAETAGFPRRARLALALGLLAMLHGGAREARGWLEQAAQHARDCDLSEVLARALQGLGRLSAELDWDDDRARELFEEAVLITEVQAAQFAHAVDAAAYRQQRHDALRELLRSACRRGDAQAAFRYQELERGRLLLELWRSGGQGGGRTPLWDSPELAQLDREIAECESQIPAQALSPAEVDQRQTLLQRRGQLLRQRDRLLEDHLRDRSRRGSAALPTLPELSELQAALPPGTLYIAPSIIGDEIHVLGVSKEEITIRSDPGALGLLEAVARWRGCVAAQLERYRRGLPLGETERRDLDACLEEMGRGPLGTALGDLLEAQRPQRVIWVADEPLQGVPLSALRLASPLVPGRSAEPRRTGATAERSLSPVLRRKLAGPTGGECCYLIERVEVAHTFSGALLVHQARTRRQRRSAWRSALIVTESPEVLPAAQREGRGVAATFWRSQTLHGSAGDRTTLRRWLARVHLAHFACHADFDAARPLAAQLHLPSGASLRALDWLDEPVAGLNLVTLSACRSGEVGTLLGREVFGLVTGLLGAGVRSVLASFWPVADRETLPLMWRFYRQLLTSDPCAALARAQRESLQDPQHSPLFWAAFALLGEPDSLPAPGWPWSWLARWRQRRHQKRFVQP